MKSSLKRNNIKPIDSVKNNLISMGIRESSLCLAVSGGADSVAMLLIFCALKDEFDLEISVRHFEHGIRGKESLEDADFVNKLCNRLKVPFILGKEDIPTYAKAHGMTLEEAARHCRYVFLSKAHEPIIATAHNCDDNAETVLFNLVRGTGAAGLCGIGMDVAREGKRIIRPLINVSREKIEEYLKENNQQFRTDSTNEDTKYSRNLIRQEVMPLLKKINSNATEHINSAAKIIKDIEDYKNDEVKNILNDTLINETMLCWLKLVSPSVKDIGSVHLNSVKSLLNSPTGSQVDIPRGKVIKEYDKLIYKKSYTKQIDCDMIKDTLLLRNANPNDYFTINANLNKKKFNRFCIDEKIPRDKRESIPVIADGNHIVWAIGYRMSEYYKVKASTSKILEITVKEIDDGR